MKTTVNPPTLPTSTVFHHGVVTPPPRTHAQQPPHRVFVPTTTTITTTTTTTTKAHLPPPSAAHSINILHPSTSRRWSSAPPPSFYLQLMPIDIICFGKKPGSEMSVEVASEHVCYVHCNFCNTVLAVSVPCNTLLNIVTVRCGHCANLLSVNMGALLQPLPLQDFQNLKHTSQDYATEYGSSSKYDRIPMTNSAESDHYQVLPIRPPEKRQRVPSAYNRFIKEEIQRIKASNPDISHREAFSAAAKNWAHFPYIHFGLNLDNNKQVNCDEAIASEGAPKSQGFY